MYSVEYGTFSVININLYKQSFNDFMHFVKILNLF